MIAPLKNKRAFVQALLAALLFGLATPFSKSLLRDLQANQLAGLLYLGAALGLLPLVWRRGRAGQPLLPRDRRTGWNLLGAIFFGGMVGPVLLLVGLRQALAASVSMWLNLETVATALLARWFFHEHMGRWSWLGNAGVVLAGLLLGIGHGWGGWVALACVAGAGVAWGLDNNFTAAIDGIGPEASTFWKGLVAGATNLVIGLTLFAWRAGPGWLWALLLGGVSYGASIVLFIRAAQGLGAARAQMIFAASPLFGVLAAVLWLGESFGLLQLAAAGLLGGALALIFVERHAHAHVHELMTHAHEHRHDDAHHAHEHERAPAAERHAHRHAHAPLAHVHPHWPDLHHRHH